MKNTTHLIRTITLGITVVVLALLILAVVPMTDNFVIQSKHFLLFFSTIVFGALFLVFTVVRKRMEFATTPLILPLLLLGLSILASIFFTQPYPVEGLLGMGGVLLVSVLIPLLVGSLLPKKGSAVLIYTLAISAILLTLFSALQLVGYGPAQFINQFFGTQLPTTLLFNLAGAPLIALQVMLIAIVAVGATVFTDRKISKPNAFLIPLLIIGVGLFAWSMLPNGQAGLTLPDPVASWSVALDSVRSPRSALIGNGPESYANNYRMYKPIWMNSRDTWTAVFSSASNAPLTLIVTLGFVGLVFWLFLLVRIIRLTKKGEKSSRPIMITLTFVYLMLLFLPLNPVIIGIAALLTAAAIATNRDMYPIVELRAFSLHKHPARGKLSIPGPAGKSTSAMVYASVGILGVLLVVGTYFLGRAYYAQMLAKQALTAAVDNDGLRLYNLRQQAVAANPYLDTLRRDYALTNLVVASALANNADLSEADKQNVSDLLQQAIREARAAAVLDPGDSTNWQVLAQIYQNMIGVAQDADSWTVQSYLQAIQTNPSDPNLRIALGGVFLSQDQLDQAIGVFQQATQVKADYPNTYYNLAVALRRAGQLAQAEAAYQEVLRLLPSDSPDYATANQELEALQKEIADQPAAPTEGETDQAGRLTTPSITDQTLDQAGQSPLSRQSAPAVDLPQTDQAGSPSPEPTSALNQASPTAAP